MTKIKFYFNKFRSITSIITDTYYFRPMDEKVLNTQLSFLNKDINILLYMSNIKTFKNYKISKTI